MAGTSDSKKIIDRLIAKKFTHIITTATTLGGQSFKNYSNVLVQKMTSDEMMEFIEDKSIKLIIDATHPFAYEVSSNAMSAARTKDISYLRYERKRAKIVGVKTFENYESISDELKKTAGNILLTIGVRNLEYFSGIDRSRLFVKILPVGSSFVECEKHDILENNIIAMRGVISVALLRSIIKEFDIKYLVMKDSGVEGGTELKIKACKKERIKAYIIKRRELAYPEVYEDINKLIDSVKECVMAGNGI